MASGVAANAQLSEPAETYSQALQAREAGNYVDARALAQAAAENGDVRAAVLAGFLEEHGHGGPRDDDAAAQWYRLAAEAEDPDALFSLAVMARENRGGLELGQAEAYLVRAANAGRPEARYQLALFYIEHLDDEERARAALQSAAAEGSTDAQRDLGLMMLEGRGGPEDVPAAMEWLEAAAGGGDAHAAFAAGYVHGEGERVERDVAAATRLLRQAADAGHAVAAADYGWLVYHESDDPVERASAVSWLRQAAEAGDQEGRFRFAWALAEGAVVDQNLEESYRWLILSDAAGPSGWEGYDGDRGRLRAWLEERLSEEAMARLRAEAAGMTGLRGGD